MNSRKINIVLTILWIFIINLAIAQNITSNYYSNKLTLATDSLEKVFIYHDIILELKQSSLDQAISYNKKALALANKVNSADACGATNELMGELYAIKNYIQPAINYYLISAKIYDGLNNYRKLSSIYGNLGMLYYNNNYDTERTLYYYRKSLDYAVQLKDKILIAEAYNRIGGILFNQQNYNDALYYYLNALDIFEILVDNTNTARTLNNLGEVYRLQGNNTKALLYYNKSIELNKEIQDLHLMAITYENIGQIYSSEGDSKDAFENYHKCLDLYRITNDNTGLSELHILIADEYLKSDEIDGAFSSYNDAFQLAVNNNQWKSIKQSSLGLSKIYERKSKYDSSLVYLKTYARYNDSIIKKQMSDELFNLQTHFLRSISEKELKIKDSDIELLESEKKISSLQQNFLIFGVIALIILSIITFIRSRSRVKKEKLINLKDRLLHETQQELMRLALDSKDTDLTNFALHLVQKNEVLKQLKTDLGNLASDQDNELNRKLKDLSIHVQQSLQINKEIEEFQKKVDTNYDDFFNNLKVKFPSLTKNEKRLCALLRLNLSTKEISSLNNTSVKAVEMSRYRLRKKVNLDNQESLSEYLQNI